MPQSTTDPTLAANLNDAQRAAVEYTSGPLVVLAGPGTGKTRVITHRIARLVELDNVDPASIIAMTFTTKASGELRERLAELIGPGPADSVNAYTIHGLGYRLLLRFGDMLGLPSQPQIIDSAQQRRLMRDLISEHGVNHEHAAAGWDSLINQTLTAIASLRNHAVTPKAAEAHAAAWAAKCQIEPADWDEQELQAQRARQSAFAQSAQLYKLFDSACQTRGWLTLDDLIIQPIRLLTDHAAAAAICRDDYRHVVVDEFQDVNRAQIELLRLLSPPGSSSADLCVVGDDDQAIYAFRGADDRAFAHFAAIWPDHHQIELSENYRSGAKVINAANAVIGRATERFAPHKRIDCADPTTDPGLVQCIQLENDKHDGDVIATMLLTDRAESNRPWKDCAVIARSNGDLDRIATALILCGIPLHVHRDASPAQDPGVQDVLAWIELLIDPDAAWPARRILSRPPLGANSIDTALWERQYRSEARRFHLGDEDAADPGTFLDWLKQNHADNPAVARLCQWHEELHRFAAESTADQTIFRIITLTGVVHSELLDARGRAQRIANIVSMLRFVRSRITRLDQPADLAAFKTYYDDLDEFDQSFRTTPEDKIDGPAPGDEPEEDDAVSLMTAHGAKGLEFDTVFVPRVSPSAGYGKTGRDDGSVIPDELLGRDEDWDLKASSRAEERRIFYVACTRAQRRLVLLAKKNKTPSKSTHFFEEFTLDESTEQLVEIHDQANILAKGADLGTGIRDAINIEGEDLAKRDEHRKAVEQAKRDARNQAAAAMDATDKTSLTAQDIDAAAASLRAAAAKLAVIANANMGYDDPDWIKTEPSADQLTSISTAIRQAEPTAPAGVLDVLGKIFKAPKPPLDLDYTKIMGYLSCPRCYFLKHIAHLPEVYSAAASIGSVAHTALETFYKSWREADAVGEPLPGLNDLLRIGKRTYFDSLAPGWPADEAQVSQLAALLQLTYENLHDPSANIIHLETKINFSYICDGIDHRFTTRLDRVDQLPTGDWRIVDYKTGRPSKKLLEPKPDDLQLGIYAMALKHLLGTDAEETDQDEILAQSRAEYWVLATGQAGKLAIENMKLDKVRTKIDKAIAGILAGEFEQGSRCSGMCSILDQD